MAVSFAALAQQEVNGVVTDETGISLPGVTVLVVNTNTGVITDFDGVYSIMVEPGATLQFSFTGMATQQIEVGNKTIIDVVLETDVIGLEAVTVIGYGVKKKVTITGAISSVGNEDLIKSPSASVTNALAGRITGIAAVQNTGQPGADEATLFIRGVATWSSFSR